MLLVLQRQSWLEDRLTAGPSCRQRCSRRWRILSPPRASSWRRSRRYCTASRRCWILLRVLQFLRLADNWGDDFRFELSRDDGRQSLRVTLNCPIRRACCAPGRICCTPLTAFSATLSPPDWTRNALGLAADAVFRRESSPFDEGQLEVYLATAVDTRYSHRQQSLPQLAATLLAWLRRESGNCIIYFPSYRYLQDCLAHCGHWVWMQCDPTCGCRRGAGGCGRDHLLQLLEQRRMSPPCAFSVGSSARASTCPASGSPVW